MHKFFGIAFHVTISTQWSFQPTKNMLNHDEAGGDNTIKLC